MREEGCASLNTYNIETTMCVTYGCVSTSSKVAVHHHKETRKSLWPRNRPRTLLIRYTCSSKICNRTCWVGSDDLWAEKGITSSLQ